MLREEGNPRMMFPEAVEAKQDVKEWLHEFENEAELLNIPHVDGRRDYRECIKDASEHL